MVVWHIDDDDIQLELVGLTLQKAQPDVVTVTFNRANTALERMVERERPDTLILDLNMPEITGWDVLTVMREREMNVPTWILTSSIDPRDRIRADGFAFVRGFLVKPLSLEMVSGIFRG